MIQDLIKQFWSIPRALMLSILLIPAFLFLAENGNKTKEKVLFFLKQGWKVAFIFYLAFILIQTVFSRQITIPHQKIFKSFLFLKDTEWDKEIIENVLFFVPYSFLYLQAFRPSHPWKSAVILSTASSAFIEICQLLFWLGAFQIADIVHNIIGGMIGCALWVALKFIQKRIHTSGKNDIIPDSETEKEKKDVTGEQR